MTAKQIELEKKVNSMLQKEGLASLESIWNIQDESSGKKPKAATTIVSDTAKPEEAKSVK